MKKLILQEFISVDGFCADKNKTTGFFDGTYFTMSKDVDVHQGQFAQGIDLILLGANTYEMFAAYWPDATEADSAVTKMMNSVPKIVFSKSLKEVKWGSYGNISLEAGDAVACIRNLKAAADKNIIMWGSLSLARSVLKAHLFDEIQFISVPIAIGQGYKLFAEDIGPLPLRLSSHKAFTGGEVLHTYQPQTGM